MEAKDRTKTDGQAQAGMFVRKYVHSLDSKKRLTIPKEWREATGVPKRLYVLPGVNNKCLTVYPEREIAPRLQRLRNVSIADEEGRQLARTLASRSDLVSWDAQGRIRVDDELLRYAGLVNQVVLVGTFDGFELWNPDLWKQVGGGASVEQLGKVAKAIGI